MALLGWSHGLAVGVIRQNDPHALLWVAALGWVGQVCFSGRVLVQWIASERAGRPVAPRVFWWLSASGAVLLSA